MKKRFVSWVTAGLLICSCLSFGEEILTSKPTPEQLEYCRTVLNISDDLVFEPLGLRILGSGIDDAMWFAFKTEETDYTRFFNSELISADSLTNVIYLPWDNTMPEWWNTRNRTFTGGTISLPAGKWITVGFSPAEGGTVCYIFWHET